MISASIRLPPAHFSPTAVVLRHVAVTQGTVVFGGGIYNGGGLDVTDSTIAGNTESGGGGIFSAVGPMDDSLILGNTDNQNPGTGKPDCLNGDGETDTHLPVRFGPAVDSGSPVDITADPQHACTRRDQRGQGHP